MAVRFIHSGIRLSKREQQLLIREHERLERRQKRQDRRKQKVCDLLRSSC